MASGHGGARPGAGRKPGQVSEHKKRMAELAREHADTAMAALAEIAADEDADARARIAAAVSILDRAYGKPLKAPPAEYPLDGGGLLDGLGNLF